MSSPSNLTRQMTMIAHSIFTEFFVTDVTISGIIINQFIMPGHYHIFGEFKLLINVFVILFKCGHTYLWNIIIAKFLYKSNWLLRIECIVKTLYVVTKSAGNLFLILIGVASQSLVGMLIVVVWRIQNLPIQWDWHWPILIFKRYFRSLFGKLNFYSFALFTILVMRS